MISFIRKGGGGTDTSDATATVNDVLQNEIFYNKDGRQVGEIIKVESDVYLPEIYTGFINNNTGYSILDINYKSKLAIIRITDTQIRVCKINENNVITTSESIVFNSSDFASIGNRNKLMGAKFMYSEDEDVEIGICATVFTNYTPWTTTYYGAIQKINKQTLSKSSVLRVSVGIPADGGGNTGVILPRPNHKDCFAWYGWFTTNGYQHCLIQYHIEGDSLKGSSVFSTNYENHGSSRFGQWTPDGNKLYVTDLADTYYVYSVSNDNKTWTRSYSNLVALTNTIAIRSGNQIYNMTTGAQVGTIDFTINNASTNWATAGNFLFRFVDNKVNIYNINSSSIDLAQIYDMATTNFLVGDFLYVGTSGNNFKIIDANNAKKELVGLIRKNITYLSKFESFDEYSQCLAITEDILE